MRILFFTDHFRPEPSAPASHIYDRCRYWVGDGHEVTVVTSAPNFPDGVLHDGYANRLRALEDMDGIRVVRVKTFMAPNRGFVLRVIDYLSYMLMAWVIGLFEKRPDVVISSSPHMFVPLAGIGVAALKRRSHVMEVRDLWPASIVATGSMRRGIVYRILEFVEMSMYRLSAHVIAFSAGIRDDICRRGIPSAKVTVVRNGADLRLFTPTEPDAAITEETGIEGEFVVGYLGTHGLAHDLGNVIATAALMRDENVRFLFVGAGATRESLIAQAGRLGLGNVTFIPRRLKEQMPAYWSVCDAALVHLKNDPVFASAMPTKVFEALAVGLPVLYVGPAGEGADFVLSTGTGLAVPPANPEALATAIRALRDDEAGRSSMAKRAIEEAPAHSRRRMADETLMVLREAVR